MAYSVYSKPPEKSHRAKWLIIFLLLLAIVGAGAYWFVIRKDSPQANNTDNASSQTREPEPEPSYTAIDLQPTIDTWVAGRSADYHIAVYDLQADKLIGSHQPDEALFAASLYKLYIAYLSYKDFESGAQDPNEVILAGQTRLECVDKMIRSSDSPCGETFMSDLGQSVLNQRVSEEINTTGTIFNGIETSATDSIEVLKRIYVKKFLTDEYYDRFMDSLLNQPAMYRRGLAAGAPEATWYTKVGWNLDINYHDVGLMKMPDGRMFAVAILGQGSGSPAPIADFAKTIYTALML